MPEKSKSRNREFKIGDKVTLVSWITNMERALIATNNINFTVKRLEPSYGCVVVVNDAGAWWVCADSLKLAGG